MTWYAVDHQSSTRLLLDNTGAVTGTMAYTAFGVITTASGSAASEDHGYTGAITDAINGLEFHRVRARYAASNTWLSEDPSGLTPDINVYRFIGNRVTTGRDPSGLDYLETSDGHAYYYYQKYSWLPGGDETLGWVHVGKVEKDADGKKVILASAPPDNAGGYHVDWGKSIDYNTLDAFAAKAYIGEIANPIIRTEENIRGLALGGQHASDFAKQSVAQGSESRALVEGYYTGLGHGSVILANNLTFELIPSLDRHTKELIQENDYQASDALIKGGRDVLLMAAGGSTIVVKGATWASNAAGVAARAFRLGEPLIATGRAAITTSLVTLGAYTAYNKGSEASQEFLQGNYLTAFGKLLSTSAVAYPTVKGLPAVARDWRSAGSVVGDALSRIRIDPNALVSFPKLPVYLAPKGVQVNKAAGDAVRDVIAVREAPALTEQSFTTVGGVRRIDVLKQGAELVGIESKVGRTALDSRVRQELARDWWLLRQRKLDRVVWEFSPSEVTGKVGPTKRLLEKLQKLGIDVRINNP